MVVGWASYARSRTHPQPCDEEFIGLWTDLFLGRDMLGFLASLGWCLRRRANVAQLE